MIHFDPSGKVVEVTAQTSIPGCDKAIMDQIRASWRCKPPKPLPFHAVFPIQFKIN